MNNIHEKDWAEDCWHGHTGMDSDSDYCFTEDVAAGTASKAPETVADLPGEARREEKSSGQKPGPATRL